MHSIDPVRDKLEYDDEKFIPKISLLIDEHGRKVFFSSHSFQTSTCEEKVTRAIIFHPSQCVYQVHLRFHDTNEATFRSNSLKIRSIKSICCVIL